MGNVADDEDEDEDEDDEEEDEEATPAPKRRDAHAPYAQFIYSVSDLTERRTVHPSRRGQTRRLIRSWIRRRRKRKRCCQSWSEGMSDCRSKFIWISM